MRVRLVFHESCHLIDVTHPREHAEKPIFGILFDPLELKGHLFDRSFGLLGGKSFLNADKSVN